MNTRPLVIIFVLLLVSHCYNAGGNLIKLTEYVGKLGARCLDGTPPAIYYKKGDPKKFLIYFEGGGWCWGLDDCLVRSKGGLGSSKDYPPIVEFGGIFQENLQINPDFGNFSYVYVKYCDGGSFAGNVKDPVVVQGQEIYFRGHRNLLAVLEYLIANAGLKSASDVIISGGSAGGVSAFLHTDFIASYLGSSVNVVGVPDSGFFPVATGIDGSMAHGYYARLKWVMENMNVSTADQMNAGCFEQTPAEHRWQCMGGQYIYPRMKSRTFIVNSALDQACLYEIAALPPPCVEHPTKSCNKNEYDFLVGFRNQFLNALNMSLAFNPNSYNGVNGGFISTCIEHVELMSDRRFFDTKINNISMYQALSAWFYKKPGAAKWYIDGPYPQNPTCENRG